MEPAAQGEEVGGEWRGAGDAQGMSLIREYLSGDLNKARGEP